MYGYEPGLFVYADRLPVQKISWIEAIFINRHSAYYQRERRIQNSRFRCTAPAVMAVVMTTSRYYDAWKIREMLAAVAPAWFDMTLAAVAGGEGVMGGESGRFKYIGISPFRVRANPGMPG